MLQNCRYQEQGQALQIQAAGDPCRAFPDLLLPQMQIGGPLPCVVSNTTAFCVKDVYYELALFMDMHATGEKPVRNEIDDYILLFNEQRPACSLNYLAPERCREPDSAAVTA